VRPVRADGRVELGEQRPPGGAERLGSQHGQRVAYGRGQEVAALQEVGFEEGDRVVARLGDRAGSGEVEGAAPVQEDAFGHRHALGRAGGRGHGAPLPAVDSWRVR
jgi:hypothetical protein